MECSRCGSQNIKTFEMAHASFNVGVSSWDSIGKILLLGPLGLMIKPGRNSVASITAPPEKPFPILGVVFGFLFLSTMVWLVSIYLRRGWDYRETQDALMFNAVMFVIASAVMGWDFIQCAVARKRYPELLDQWIHSWICLQCGTTYEVRKLPRA
jgi:hypothetical protein